MVALCSEPRQVQEPHDVGSLESLGVVAPALGVKHVTGPVRYQGRLSVWGVPRGRHGGDVFDSQCQRYHAPALKATNIMRFLDLS